MRRGSSAIELADDRRQRGAADPEPAAFVTEQVSPASRPARAPIGIDAVRDRPGTRDDHDARLIARSGHECDERIVDDDHARLETDPCA